LKLASKYIGNKFGCLSLTLEMPFKDNANLPDERVGWNGERSAALGAAMLQAILWHVERF
jgi:murein tripeptide amidase MpaA